MKCTDESEAFDTSPELFILFLRIIAVISTTVNLFGLYCVLFKTPSHFREYRIILAIYQLAITYMDFHVSILVEPVLYLPLPFAQTRGLLQFQSVIKIEAIFIWTLVGMSIQICSIMALFQYRVHSIAPPDHYLKINRYWALMFARLSPLVIDLVCLLLGCLLVPRGDLTKQTELIKSEYLCVSQLLQDPQIETFDRNVFRMLMIFEIVTIACSCVAAVFFITLSYSFIRSSPAISQQTIKLQQRFQKSLCMQVLGPILCTSAPATIVTILTLGGSVGFQPLTNFFIAMFAMFVSYSNTFLYSVHKMPTAEKNTAEVYPKFTTYRLRLYVKGAGQFKRAEREILQENRSIN